MTSAPITPTAIRTLPRREKLLALSAGYVAPQSPTPPRPKPQKKLLVMTAGEYD